MRSRSMIANGAFPRVAVICLVVGAHAIAIVLLLSVRREVAVAGQERYVVWLPLLPARPRTEPDRINPERTLEVRQRLRPAESVVPIAPQARGVEAVTRPSLHDQASFYARRAVEEATAERYRNLGPRKSPALPELEAPTMFDPDKRVFGETGEDAMDDPIVRIRENCYLELSKTVNTAKDYVEMAAATKLSPPMLKCMFSAGSSEPRGDLFEHLKKDRPPPKVAGAPDLPERTQEQSER